uniref:Uncharacterized protein n=1 Tax=Oryza punctata TaxID=4537 RepID=A0A0E0MBK7_ORYPU
MFTSFVLHHRINDSARGVTTRKTTHFIQSTADFAAHPLRPPFSRRASPAPPLHQPLISPHNLRISAEQSKGLRLKQLL